MTPANFEDLALRTLENPSDAVARTALDRLLHAHPELRPQWVELVETYQLTGDLLAARQPAGATIPADRLAALETQVARRPRRTRTGWWTPLGLAAALALLAALGRLPAPAPIDATSTLLNHLAATTHPLPSALRNALTAPLAAVVRTTAFAPQRSEQTLHLRSPLLAATAGPVTIAWTGSDPTPVTITLRELGQTLWQTTGPGPTVTTPAVPADRVFEILIQPTAGGNVLREEFLTVAPSPAPADPLLAVVTAATATPARLGEAVLGWWALPDELRLGLTGRRVGLWLATVAQQPDLRAACLASAPLDETN